MSYAQLQAAIEATMRDDVTAIGICAPGPLNPEDRGCHQSAEPSRLGEHPAGRADLARIPASLPRGKRRERGRAGGGALRRGARVFDGVLRHGEHRRRAAASFSTEKSITAKAGRRARAATLPSTIGATPYADAACRAASRRWLRERRLRAGRECRRKQVGRAAAQGDARAIEILDETALMLSAWLGSVVNLLDPDIIVIGGGRGADRRTAVFAPAAARADAQHQPVCGRDADRAGGTGCECGGPGRRIDRRLIR